MTGRSDRFWRRAAGSRTLGGTVYSAQRRDLLADLSGTVLELGPGAGANGAYFPSGVRWIGLEPNPYLHEQLRRGGRGQLIGGDAGCLPLADGSVDAVAATLVLCSIEHQSRVLSEVLRVLRPHGRFVFLEHVRAPEGSWSHRAQQIAAPFSRRLDGGCDPTRETGRAIRDAGFATVEMREFVRRGPLGVGIPHVFGRATAPA